MNVCDLRSAACAVAVLLTCLLSAPLVGAQTPPTLFPLEEGRSWTYHMSVEVGGQRKAIVYTTTVVRTEELDGVGACAVLESRSDKRLMQVEWYRAEEGKVLNPQRQDGPRAAPKAFKERVFLDLSAVQKLDDDPEARPSWAWADVAGQATGTLTLAGKERVKIGTLGFFECYVLVDEGTYTVGTAVRVQERRLWLAPDLGIVKEVMTVKNTSGEVTIKTESELQRYAKP